mmetsp:Transcript_28149/g.69322  ORF Transcript_28149/g.69322 Transcript_28149/m.69322 type:complete len:88 (+) Transcript_28149:957-1220(+)
MENCYSMLEQLGSRCLQLFVLLQVSMYHRIILKDKCLLEGHPNSVWVRVRALEHHMYLRLYNAMCFDTILSVLIFKDVSFAMLHYAY